MYKSLSTCRCCGGSRLQPYLDLSRQPLANSYHTAQGELPRFPLEVFLCRDCFHSQLGVAVAPELMFAHYLYTSGTTYAFHAHCQELAEDAVKRTQSRRPTVLDIAANDGTLLEKFRHLGCDVMGVDPAENLRTFSAAKGIPVLVDYWGERAARAFGRRFDVITATNVFAHVEDLCGFLQACRLVLAVEGTLVIEFPYCDRMIADCEFDTIYHEHLSYFLLHPLLHLADRCGFSIVDVLQTPIHGGSIRLYLRADAGGHAQEVDRIVDRERSRELLTTTIYDDFATRACEHARQLRHALNHLAGQNRPRIGYGASAKGNTLLNFAGIDLEYVVDDNRLKWGLLTPGRNVPIRPTHVLAEEPQDLCILVLAWNFLAEIARRVHTLRPKRHDQFLVYVPSVRTVSVEELAQQAAVLSAT
jgi:SAM-dependent methyltransferase